MPDTLTLFITVLAVGTLIGIAIERAFSKQRRQAWPKRNRSRTQGWADKAVLNRARGHRPDAADQLRTVMRADFSAKPVLNRSEARLFNELGHLVRARNTTWQVLAQVSLGEILSCKDTDGYSCINSKRVDLLLMDDACMPRHAIEYQGKAHHQSAAAARDAVKKEALRRAGIGYHEVIAGEATPAELKQLIEKLISSPESVR
ncbi:MAG: DUF2726 domain-containing protein [Vitreimonas sp.]